jgi:hypothetical protein
VADGFLGRWSQRKQALREGKAPPEPVAPPDANRAPDGLVSAPTGAAKASGSVDVASPPPQVPAPTLDDVRSLTPDDSFARFVAPDVAPDVRNAAMKKLFADPHYQVMDGLDIYIDDYSLPSPLPAAMLKEMVSAQFLKLVDEPEAAHIVVPADDLNPVPAPEPAPPDLTPCPPSHHDHTDLRLQPNHAAAGAEPECGAERAPDPAQHPVPP